MQRSTVILMVVLAMAGGLIFGNRAHLGADTDPKPQSPGSQFELVQTKEGLWLFNPATGDTWIWTTHYRHETGLVDSEYKAWQYFDRPTRIEGCILEPNESLAVCLDEPKERMKERKFRMRTDKLKWEDILSR